MQTVRNLDFWIISVSGFRGLSSSEFNLRFSLTAAAQKHQSACPIVHRAEFSIFFDMPDEVVREEDKPVKINKWDGNALKNALDDAVRKVFTVNQEYKEDFKIMDGRLAISTVSVLFSLIALAYDWFYPFPASKWVLACCSVSYFISVGILTAYLWWIEKGIFLVFRDGKSTWNATSSLKKYDDIYTLSLTRKTEGGSAAGKEQELKKSVAEYFDDEGTLQFGRFEADVLRLFRTIGEKKSK